MQENKELTKFDKLMQFLQFRSVKEMTLTFGCSETLGYRCKATGEPSMTLYAHASDYSGVSVKDLKAL